MPDKKTSKMGMLFSRESLNMFYYGSVANGGAAVSMSLIDDIRGGKKSLEKGNEVMHMTGILIAVFLAIEQKLFCKKGGFHLRRSACLYSKHF